LLHQSYTISLSATGVSSFNLICEKIYYQLELDAVLFSMLDFDLSEWIDAARMAFRISTRLTWAQAQTLYSFISAPAKQLTIDSKQHPVVNDAKNFDLSIDFWQGFTSHGFVDLRFRRSIVGLDLPDAVYAVLETQDGTLVETQDGSLIEIR